MSDQDQPERAIRMRRNHQLTRDRVPIHGDPGVTDIALGSTAVRVDQRDTAQPGPGARGARTARNRLRVRFGRRYLRSMRFT